MGLFDQQSRSEDTPWFLPNEPSLGRSDPTISCNTNRVPFEIPVSAKSHPNVIDSFDPAYKLEYNETDSQVPPSARLAVPWEEYPAPFPDFVSQRKSLRSSSSAWSLSTWNSEPETLHSDSLIPSHSAGNVFQDYQYFAPSSHAGENNQQDVGTGEDSRQQTSIAARKRVFASAFPREELDSDAQIRKAPPRAGTTERRVLACPFQKRNPHEHQRCLKYTLHRVKDVKQHVYRHHKQPDYYCARCSTIFATVTDRDEHTRRADCTKAPMRQFEGITDEQRSMLHKSSSRTLSHQDQWFQMWDLIFPGEKRPASALVGSFTEETIPLIRSLWSNKRDEILDKVLDSNSAETFHKSQLDCMMGHLFDALEVETSGLLAGNASPPKVELTKFNSDASLPSGLVSLHRTITSHFEPRLTWTSFRDFDLVTSRRTSRSVDQG